MTLVRNLGHTSPPEIKAQLSDCKPVAKFLPTDLLSTLKKFCVLVETLKMRRLHLKIQIFNFLKKS